MKILRTNLPMFFFLTLLFGGFSLSSVASTERLNIELTQLLEINADQTLEHEGTPKGVPKSYDWAKRPRLGAGNHPGNFSAITGWGQVFSIENTAENLGYVQLRNLQTLICHGAARKWVGLQAGDIEGREFRSDFQSNINKPAPLFQREIGVTNISFEAGAAFHFWPLQGRAQLPDKDICGVVVLLQARVENVSNSAKAGQTSGGYLLGLGADYWLNKASPWDRYKTNRDVAIGRLKLITSSWSWFGLSTASDNDLRRLFMEGYEVGKKVGWATTGLSKPADLLSCSAV